MEEKVVAKVTVIKRKKGIPTVIEFEGQSYILRPENQYQGGGGQRGKKI